MFLPVADSVLPARDTWGAFWADRGDRRHCGVDLYAPAKTPVVAIAPGVIVGVGPFTSQEANPYWNPTVEVLVQSAEGFWRYAELGDAVVEKGANVQIGTLLGHVGCVIDAKKVTKRAPRYVRELVKNEATSMLHLELWERDPPPASTTREYLGGNWFGHEMPDGLRDPSILLRCGRR